MQQEIDNEMSPPVEVKPVHVSLRDKQRDALRDLLILATQCAATEGQIEQQFRIATEKANKEWIDRQKEIETRNAEMSDSLTREHQRKLQAINSDYESRCAKCKDEYAQSKARIKWEHEAAEKKTRNQVVEAKWLAEGEVETARNQIRVEAADVAKLLHDYEEAIAAVEKQAVNLLSRCCMPPAMEESDATAQLAGQEMRTAMPAQLEIAQQQAAKLERLLMPRLVFGAPPWIALMFLCGGAAGLAYSLSSQSPANIKIVGIATGAMFVIAMVIGMVLRAKAKARSIAIYKPLMLAILLGRAAANQYGQEVSQRHEKQYADAREKATQELETLKQKAAAAEQALQTKRDSQRADAKAHAERKLANISADRDKARQAADAELHARQEAQRKKYEADIQAAREQHDHATQESVRQRDEALIALRQRLQDGLVLSRSVEEPGVGGGGRTSGKKSVQAWADWVPPTAFPALVRFGELRVDLKKAVDESGAGGAVKLQFPAAFSVPATLAFPYGASLLVQYDHAGRQQALRMVQSVMLRILTSLPPGRARFTLIDPVGLGQSFAGFMRLADHDEALVGGRIWTQPDQIEERLSDLTEHMETVIQKYLRNEYATIDEYNAQAGELAEPYRFVVVADYPAGFEQESVRRLASIAATGARCGVYILAAGELSDRAGSGESLEDMAGNWVRIVKKDDAFVWKDDVFGQFPLTLDEPPAEAVLTPLLDRIGTAAKESQHVEVSFEAIAPSPEEFWSLDSGDSLAVPIGRMGATRLQMLRLGKAMAQHGLLAGKTGSGKSTLLHAIVTNLAMWYSPDQVEVYLIDFKKGVEFKVYATHKLPHARAIAVESDREFGVSVLERLDVELGRRGELFRKAGVQDLPSYRRTPGAQVMPRTLLVIDEFQEFFSEDDKLAQQASLLMDRLVRQGRAFGIHLLLGSQTIGGTSGLARSTISQMGVRIALQVSEADSQIILGDNNSAARLLSRPGAAIYNDSGGLVEANSPFQVAWLADDKREMYLDKISQRAEAAGRPPVTPIVFEGNAPADVGNNPQLTALLAAPKPSAAPTTAIAWLGEPVAIKEPTSISLRHQSGANVMLVGQQEEQSLSVLIWTLISLASQYPVGGAVFHVLDGAPADSRLAGMFERIKPAVGQEMRLHDWRAIPDAIHELAQETSRRQTAEPAQNAEIFIFIYGLQRYRMLRKSDDDFSFSSSSGDEAKAPNPAKEFGEILRDGPAVGIHVLAWVDTLASLERTFDRSAQKEFDNRILFQMSATDSSNLIDSPAANTLGFYRALSCSEEQGVMEKFRPYALPSAAWIQEHLVH